FLGKILATGPTLEHPLASRLETVEDSSDPAAELMRSGLLVALSETTLAVPREVALPLRGGVWKSIPDAVPAAPDLNTDTTTSGLDAALRAVADVSALLRALRASPIKIGRRQILNRKDVARVAEHLDWEGSHLWQVAACAAAAGLLAIALEPQECVTADHRAAAWEHVDPADQWVQLELAWRECAAVIVCLLTHQTLDARTVPATHITHATAACRIWADLVSEGVALSDHSLVVARPRLASHVGSLFDVARRTGEWLGLTVDFVPSALGRHSGSPQSLTDHVRRMQGPGIEQFFVQPDHTVIVPGRPATQIRRMLRAIATTESEDRALVARLTPASLRHGIESGHSGEDILNFLTRHSATGVPQSLEYLIRDLDRAPAQIEIVSDICLVKLPPVRDVGTVTAPLTSAGFQILAITEAGVLVRGDTRPVEHALREAGLITAASAHDNIRGAAPGVGSNMRLSDLWPQAAYTAPNPTVAQMLLANHTDAGYFDQASEPPGPPADLAWMSSRLLEAAQAQDSVSISFANPDGSVASSRGPVMHIGNGFVTVYDETHGQVRTIALSRISNISA
ncbi:MAG: hypothetical protein EB027_03965, partial [Actinobacteria bacterium]|nr:hypothetical protein [Actinomycetota bacterium]